MKNSSPTTSLKQKVILISFGLFIGLLAIEIIARVVFTRPSGAEFENLQDLRRAMLAVDSQTPVQNQSERSVDLREIVTPHPNDRIIYQLRSNLDVKFQRVRVTTNSCALRGPERPIAKPAGVFRIALLGDSYAFGWGVEQDKIFAKVLEDELTEYVGPERSVEVINLAVPGYSTFQEVALLQETGLDFDPDLVLVFFVQNDFGFPFYVRSIENPQGLMSGLIFSNVLSKTTDSLVREQGKELLGYDANRAMLDLLRLTQEHELPLVVAFNPHKRWKEDYHKLWALRENPEITPLIFRNAYLQTIYERNIEETELVLPHDKHPSAARHQIFGELLAERLREYVN